MQRDFFWGSTARPRTKSGALPRRAERDKARRALAETDPSRSSNSLKIPVRLVRGSGKRRALNSGVKIKTETSNAKVGGVPGSPDSYHYLAQIPWVHGITG